MPCRYCVPLCGFSTWRSNLGNTDTPAISPLSYGGPGNVPRLALKLIFSRFPNDQNPPPDVDRDSCSPLSSLTPDAPTKHWRTRSFSDVNNTAILCAVSVGSRALPSRPSYVLTLASARGEPDQPERWTAPLKIPSLSGVPSANGFPFGPTFSWVTTGDNGRVINLRRTSEQDPPPTAVTWGQARRGPVAAFLADMVSRSLIERLTVWSRSANVKPKGRLPGG